jgi:hypothetical protein
MKLVVSGISAAGLDDTGSMFDGQDPGVQLKIGSASHTTERCVIWTVLCFAAVL